MRNNWRNAFILLLFGVLYLITILSIWLDGDSKRRDAWVHPDQTPYRPLYSTTDTLIIIPGHGVLNALNASGWKEEKNWGLEMYQLREGVVLPFCFAAHIRRGVEKLKEQINSSLLVFSGGQTRPGTGPRSEGLSYYILAEESRLFGLFESNVEVTNVLNSRVFAEEFARDSYENLLFSVARFFEITARFPENIVVVGWKHKKRRFVEFHRKAIRFPYSRFTYIGLDFEDAGPFVDNLEPYRKAKRYDDHVALSYVSEDLYLCNAGKRTREVRNPLFRTSPYEVSCPALQSLLRHCGPRLIDNKLVPWS